MGKKRVAKAATVVAASIAVIVAVAAAVAPWAICWKLKKWGDERGLRIEAARVDPGLRRVVLEGVRIEGELARGVRGSAALDRVEVDLEGAASVSGVKVEGGTVNVSGRRPETNERTASHPKSAKFRASGLSVAWNGFYGTGSVFTGEGVKVWKEGSRASMEADSFRAEAGGVRVEGKSLTARNGSEGPELKAETVEVRIGREGLREDSEKPPPVTGREKPFKAAMEAKTVKISYGILEATAEDSSIVFKREEDGMVKAELRADLIRTWNAVESRRTDAGGTFDAARKTVEFWSYSEKVRILDRRLSFKDFYVENVETIGTLSVEDGISVRGQVRVDGFGTEVEAWKRNDGKGVKIRTLSEGDGDGRVPCADLKRAFQSLMEGIEDVEMDGFVGIRLDIASDKKEDVRVDFKLDERCRVTKVPDRIRAARFRGRFERTVTDDEGEERIEVTGRGTEGWVPMGAVSQYVPLALIATEDPGFRRHRGFDEGAIENSIRDNAKAGKFLRGASTISMQLAKNLWLDREKTLQRKAVEAVLTRYLEQEFDKGEILELYMNVAEFAPGVYGIGKAASLYFKTNPKELSLAQSLFLALMLPKPSENWFGKDGRLSRGRTATIRHIMKRLKDAKILSEDEYAEGVKEEVVKGKSRMEALRDSDAADWQ